MTSPSRSGPSPVFAQSELNGDVLLSEGAQLREAQVRQKHLDDCALMLRTLRGLPVAEAGTRARQIAGGRFSSQPVLGALLVRWVTRLRTDADVDALVDHFERLALVSGVLAALGRAQEREGSRPE